jgi:hypothetical protein
MGEVIFLAIGRGRGLRLERGFSRREGLDRVF